MTSVKLNWTAAALAAVSFAIPTTHAQDANTPGIVRISDGRSRAAVRPASFHGHRHAAVYEHAGDCPTGDCPAEYCPNGHCHRGCDYGCFQETYCKKSPDYGYSPPAKYPLHRRGIQYNTMFPNQWYGLPGGGLAGGYPMVYQPTDTTQLGFYYQHVPFWQPNPNMLPQRPVPAEWHVVAPPYNANLFATRGGIPCFVEPNYPVEYRSVAPTQNGMPTPVDAPKIVPSPAPPATETSAEPSPRQIQTTTDSEHIRRAGN